MKLSVGDKVRYKEGGTSDGWAGVEGVLTASGDWGSTVKVTKTTTKAELMVGDEYYPYLYNLEKIEETFTFKDIRVGDTINRTRKYPTGALEVREGTVMSQGYDWVSQGNFILAYASDDENEQVTLKLIERPEPEQHWTEEKPVGSIALGGAGTNKLMLKKTTDSCWTRTFLTNNLSSPYTLKETERYFGIKELEWIK